MDMRSLSSEIIEKSNFASCQSVEEHTRNPGQQHQQEEKDGEPRKQEQEVFI